MRVGKDAVLATAGRVPRFIIEHLALQAGVVDLTAARDRLEDFIASFTTHRRSWFVPDEPLRLRVLHRSETVLDTVGIGDGVRCRAVREFLDDIWFCVMKKHAWRHLRSAMAPCVPNVAVLLSNRDDIAGERARGWQVRNGLGVRVRLRPSVRDW